MKIVFLYIFMMFLSNTAYADKYIYPDVGEPFDVYLEHVDIYLEENKVWINEDNKTLEKQAVMPYEIKPSSQCASVTGLLFIHGLSDSPYSLKSMAQALLGECVWIRGVLLPGHGTKAEDLLDVKFSDWQLTVKSATESFSEKVDSLYLVGYSTGGGLALDYAANSKVDLAGLILLSPLLKINSSLDWLPSLLTYFTDWLDHDESDDYVKYASIPIPAMAEAYRLAFSVRSDLTAQKVLLPVFVVVSDEDTTLDSSVTVTYFQQTLLNPNSSLQLYSSDPTKSTLKLNDNRISVTQSYSADLNVSSLSHLAVHVAPADSHYGQHGDYRACNWYLHQESFSECKMDENNWYGEKGELLTSKSEHGARMTWNPFFADLIKDVRTFIHATKNESK